MCLLAIAAMLSLVLPAHCRTLSNINLHVLLCIHEHAVPPLRFLAQPEDMDSFPEDRRIGVDTGENVQLNCTAAAGSVNSIPNIVWLKDGVSIVETLLSSGSGSNGSAESIVSISSSVLDSVTAMSLLMIEDFTIGDGGVYRCRAENNMSAILSEPLKLDTGWVFTVVLLLVSNTHKKSTRSA